MTGTADTCDLHCEDETSGAALNTKLKEFMVQPWLYVNTGNKQAQNGFQNYFQPSR